MKRYILAHRCDACDAAPGHRHHGMKATLKAKREAVKAKRKIKPNSKTAATVATSIAPAVESQTHL